MDYTRLKIEVESMIKKERFIHSLGVAETALYLARRFGIDENKALCAGIYHDAYRYRADEASIAELEKSGFIIEPEEKAQPMLLHGALSALHFDEDAGEEVPADMKAAVRHHTLGSCEMGKLGAVIYVADYMEPGRKHLSEEDRLNILEKGTLEEMVISVLEMERPYLESTKAGMAGVSEKLYDYLAAGGKFEG